jgi:hypothetical integral membrane protein (TIGR02206 family)
LRQFSPEHIAALCIMTAAIAWSVRAARRDPGPRIVTLSRVLAVIVLAGWVGEYVADAVLGIWSFKYNLPLQLTDAVSLACVLALWTRNALLVELTYFWALSASLQATLTPDLAQSFPSVFYFTYFTYHTGAVVAACLLVFGCGLYPRPGAVPRVYAATFVVTVVAGAADLLTGGNYMYLRSKPEHSSLLNAMGPWPLYILSTAALGLVLLYALQGVATVARSRHLQAAR